MPCETDVLLYKVFEKYCNFAQRHASSTSESAIIMTNGRKPSLLMNTPQMDGSKFAKLTREAGLVDGKLITINEVDIIFSRVKEKTERKISFFQFLTALKILAQKKYSGASSKEELDMDSAERKVLDMVKNLQGPLITPGTTLPPKESQFIDRLMVGPATYVGSSPKDDSRTWKDDLRQSPNSSSSITSTPPPSRRSSGVIAVTPVNLRKSSLNSASMQTDQSLQ